MIALLIWVALLLPPVWGNTEKTIFLGPSPANVQSKYPGLNDLRLGHLSPEISNIRTHLSVEFPDDELRRGKASWFFLHNLTEGQRYEVRVCWAATNPTAFVLEAYDLDTVFGAPDLMSDLSEYSSTFQLNMENHIGIPLQAVGPDQNGSAMLLRIFAAADFYTRNQTLMRDVPPVHVDIILDPFISNVVPRSLLPTVTYVIAVAITSWFTGSCISSWIRQIAPELAKQGMKYQ